MRGGIKMSQFPTVLLIFILTYLIIVSEKIHRTTIAFVGAILLIIFNILSLEGAIEYIDFHTIGLLIGMMIIVNIMKTTGIFQYLAIKAAKKAKGEPIHLLITLAIITAICSALLDNVTTVLLIVPVTIVITEALEISPIPFLITQILASNIGGASTLIGDPPNIMIGSQTGLGFLEFVINLAPVIVVIFAVTLFIVKRIYKKQLVVDESNMKKIMEFDENRSITDKKLLVKSGIVILFTILGFMLHQFVGMESATVALTGAAILLLISRVDPEHILKEVEWTTIFFFAFLFILVGGLEHIGVLDIVASKLMAITHGNLFLTTMLVLWISAIMSAFLDNIPFVATMIPLLQSVGAQASFSIEPLWWALALGACLGGNGTLVGASANVVVAGILEKHNHRISFGQYFKIAFPLMLLSIAISTIYIYFIYLR